MASVFAVCLARTAACAGSLAPLSGGGTVHPIIASGGGYEDRIVRSPFSWAGTLDPAINDAFSEVQTVLHRFLLRCKSFCTRKLSPVVLAAMHQGNTHLRVPRSISEMIRHCINFIALIHDRCHARFSPVDVAVTGVPIDHTRTHTKFQQKNLTEMRAVLRNYCISLPQAG